MSTLLTLLGVGLGLAWIAWREMRRWRSGVGRARREMVAAARTLSPDDLYLVRDEHVVLWRNRMWALCIPVLTVVRCPEDDFHAINEGGSGMLGSESFRVMPGLLEVVCRRDVGQYTAQGEDIGPDRGWWWSPGKAWRGLRMPAAMVYASPDDLRGLATQIRLAESVGKFYG